MINLLPPSQKKDLRQEKNFKLVLTFGLLSISCLLSLGLILFLIKIMINAEMSSRKMYFEQKESQMERLKDLQNKIVESNKVFSDLDKFYSEQIDYSSSFEKIGSAVPDGISISSISFPSEENGTVNVSLNGFSKTRETLKSFKDGLESKPSDFSDIAFPPESWIKKTDIDFAIKFKILKSETTKAE